MNTLHERIAAVLAVVLVGCGGTVTPSHEDTTPADVATQYDSPSGETGEAAHGDVATDSSDAATVPDEQATTPDVQSTPDVAIPDASPVADAPEAGAAADTRTGPPPCGDVGETCCTVGTAWACSAAWSECVFEFPTCVACGGVGQTTCGWYDNHEGAAYVGWTTYGCNPAVAVMDSTTPGAPCIACGTSGGTCCSSTGGTSCNDGSPCNLANNRCP